MNKKIIICLVTLCSVLFMTGCIQQWAKPIVPGSSCTANETGLKRCGSSQLDEYGTGTRDVYTCIAGEWLYTSDCSHFYPCIQVNSRLATCLYCTEWEGTGQYPECKGHYE